MDRRLQDPQIRSLVTAASGRLYAGFAAAGLHATDDAGATWTLRIAGLSNTEVDALAYGPGGSLLAGTYDGVFASQDGGLTWTRAGTDLAGAKVHGLHTDPQGRILAWVSSSAGNNVLVWRSDDGGATWQPKFTSDDLDFGGFFEDSVMAPDGRLYVGGMSFLVRARVITSGDGGDTWQIHDLESVAPLQALAAGSDGRVYAAADDEAVLVTDDDGTTWTPLGSVPWQTHAAVLVANAPDDLLVGTQGDGVYRSTDGGATWQAFSDGLPGTGNQRPSLSAMAVQAGHVFAGTGNHGLFRSPLDAITATPDDGVPAPTHLTLRNQPNPFNPRTTLNFTLPQTTQARLTLHDVRGRLVRVLVEGTLAVGSHAVTWGGHGADGRAMASGVYLARPSWESLLARGTGLAVVHGLDALGGGRPIGHHVGADG